MVIPPPRRDSSTPTPPPLPSEWTLRPLPEDERSGDSSAANGDDGALARATPGSRSRIPFDDEADEGDVDVSLQPVDADVERARRAIREAEIVSFVVDQIRPQPTQIQFTLRHLLWGNVALAVPLALTQAIAPSLLAGTVGLVACGLLLFVTFHEPARPEPYVIAWSALGLYLLMALVALCRA